jgi:hypothetical protein
MLDQIQRLESARSIIEARFLAAGDVLSEAVDGIGALVTGLDALTHELGPAAVAASTRQLREAADSLYALPQKQDLRRAGIGRLLAQRAILSARVDDMRQSLAYMRAFTVSIKITAGSIVTADAEFGVFAQEIFLRVEAGRAEVDQLGRSLVTLQQELEAAVQRAEALARSCAGMIPAVPDQLLAVASLMAAHSARTAAAAADAGALARDVRKHVGRMLSALQIGDITRQRVEHVQAGLALMALDDPALPPPAAERMRAVLAALLAAQLEATLADFDREVAEVSLGLGGLAQDAAALLRVRDLAYGTNAAGSGGQLRGLQQSVGGALGLVKDIEQAAAQAQETGRTAALAAQVLSDRLGAVQAMKTDVVYMALNTTLKSARLGQAGRPLSTIATELRAQAGVLERVAESCMAALQSLIETAAELAGAETGPEMDLDTGVAGQAAGAALLAAVDLINAAGDASERDVAALAAQGEAVIRLLTRSTDRVAFRNEVGDALDAVAQALRALAADAEPCAADLQAPLGALFGKLGAIYTMAQERDVHAAIGAQFAVGPGVEASAMKTAPTVEDALEDVLF